MIPDTNPQPRANRRKILLFSVLPLLAVAGYVGWVMYSRWQENREIDERAKTRQNAKQIDDDRRTVEMLGGNRFEIVNFYASPSVLRRGESAQVCYGVSNAKSVRLEPPDAPVWPAYSRCFDVTPKKDTTYTLTATDANGTAKVSSVTVKVR